MSDITKTGLSLSSSTFEHIDEALLLWLREKMNLHCSTNKGWSKVNVLWVAPERSYSVKNEVNRGILTLPLITLSRESINKDPKNVGRFGGNSPAMKGYDPRGGSIPIAYRINQEKTSNFTNADSQRSNHMQINFPKVSKKVVYEIAYVPMPVYVTMIYNVNLRTEYQEQMNQLVQPFVAIGDRINYFVFESTNGHRYEGFIEGDMKLNNNVSKMGNEESRNFETTVTIKVLGYTLGAGDNSEIPQNAIHETSTEFKWGRERSVLGDEIESGPVGRKPGIDGGYRA